MGKESRLQQDCIKYLRSESIYFLNIHGGGWTAKGAPDLIVCINGKFAAFELKVDDNQQQDAQKLHEKRILKNGGLYYTPSSLREFIEIISSLEEKYE